jgi:exodeoxyribonuclease VII large subunit
MAISPAPEEILSVSALTRLIKESLEGGFPAVWVRGEISGFKRADSGHLYFSLKEGKDALVDCVMWRASAGRLAFEPRDGTEVEAFGSITVYEPRGRYQLVAKELRPGGLGALLLALEELKRRLNAEGLFDPARKRPLPRYPARIGLVTSPVGAAVRDLVKVLRSRWPSIAIVLAPTRVQGAGAAEEIAAAIGRFNRYRDVDLLIVGRGGGSLEDLWAFNEEIVVRAIAGSAIPVISAVGHEVDWTLADLAADVRAATPSNAAEIAVRDREEARHRIEALAERAASAARRAVGDRRRTLQALIEQYGFRRQKDALGFLQQRIDDLAERVRSAVTAALKAARERLREVRQRYGLREWPRTLAVERQRAEGLHARLGDGLVRGIHERRARIESLGDRLRALSPRSVLERGYCLVRRADGTLVRIAEDVTVGDRVALEFARGGADARIEAVREGEAHGE